MEKLKVNAKQVIMPIVFGMLLMIGVWLGALQVKLSSDFIPTQSGSIFFNGLFDDFSAGCLSVFSAFLFDFLFYLLLVFLFGMTFLGVAVIPVAVLFRGYTLGAALSTLLASSGMTAYFVNWLTYLPAAAFCTMVFLAFSGRAYGVSINAGRLLIGKGAAPIPLKSYGLYFLFALLLLLIASVVRCAFGFLIEILF